MPCKGATIIKKYNFAYKFLIQASKKYNIYWLIYKNTSLGRIYGTCKNEII